MKKTVTGRTAAATIAARAGIGTDVAHGAVIPPLHLSSNFTFERFGVKRAFDYTRSGNPTRALLETTLAELEEGAGSVVTATGMAAITLALQLCPADGLLVAPRDCYGGSVRLFRSLKERGRLRAELIDFGHPDVLTRLAQLRPRLVWVETPSNPLLAITDIAAVARVCRDVGTLLVVDNTFLSPALQKPLCLGADIFVHSTTKYLNGHGDVVGGAVIARTAPLLEELSFWSNCLGLSGAPFDSYQTLRGVRTLNIRIAQHQRNAAVVAETCLGHPAVRRVLYPGLSSHPGHSIAARQQSGFGAMVSVELSSGKAAAAAFVDGLTLFTLAESLGGVESLVAHPVTMTHATMTPQELKSAGIGDGLLRLSVGLEDPEDLRADLLLALARATAVEA